ncbi:MAG: hypothetical protein AAF581_11095 [Planctomycetota bacterium]
MSRTRHGGKGVGSEFWGKRKGNPYPEPNSEHKRWTNRAERRERKQALKREARDE